jgi:16S rRNA processing protein RimM
MASDGRLVTAGRVGRAHGLDGSFHVVEAKHPLAAGEFVTVSGTPRRIERRAGTDQRPLVRLEGVSDREAATGLGGELLLVEEAEAPLEPGEWLASDLVGCDVRGLGRVARVIDAPSCDVLELDDGTLIPLISDAVRSVDPAAGIIEPDLAFLGMEPRA